VEREEPQSHGLDTQEMDRRERREKGKRTGAPISRCPFCSQGPVHVLDSRVLADGVIVTRRRRCDACRQRWMTQERPIAVKVEERAERISTVRAEARRLVRSLLERLGDEG
jgi:hypothetical protein